MSAATAVKERPIIFSAPMVRAILDGRKTQTRRVVKLKHGEEIEHGAVFTADDPFWMRPCPYGTTGERLWVRETWCQKMDDGYFVYNADGNLDPSCCWFKADGVEVRRDDGNGGTALNADGSEASPWSPSIHMPRWASRITLEITDVRVQRLQDISEADAAAEGVGRIELSPGPVLGEFAGMPMRGHPATSTHEHAFRELWHTIHASNGPNGWDANPWLWCISFKRV